MTQISNGFVSHRRNGINTLTFIVAGLFILVIWQSSGISLSLIPDENYKDSALENQSLENTGAGGAGIINIFKDFIFASAGIFLHIINKDRARFTWTRAWPLVALLSLIVLSVLWSSVPDIALRRVVKQLLLIAMVALGDCRKLFTSASV